jgi:hypothetical protein
LQRDPRLALEELSAAGWRMPTARKVVRQLALGR